MVHDRKRHELIHRWGNHLALADHAYRPTTPRRSAEAREIGTARFNGLSAKGRITIRHTLTTRPAPVEIT